MNLFAAEQSAGHSTRNGRFVRCGTASRSVGGHAETLLGSRDRRLLLVVVRIRIHLREDSNSDVFGTGRLQT